jgi:sterol 14-demethylase
MTSGVTMVLLQVLLVVLVIAAAAAICLCVLVQYNVNVVRRPGKGKGKGKGNTNTSTNTNTYTNTYPPTVAYPPTVTPIIPSLASIPLIGGYLSQCRVLTFLEFSKSPLKMITRCYRDYGPVFTLSLFHQNITILLSPSYQELFFKSPDTVLSQPEVYGFMKPVFGEGVVYDCPVKKRQVQFQAMSKGLSNANMKSYVDKIEKEAVRYFNQHMNHEHGTVDLLTVLSELTILTSSRTLHGDDVRENISTQVSQLYHDLDKGVTPLSVFFPYAPTEAHAKRDRARVRMEELFGKVIRARREETPEEAASKNRTDILDVFIKTKYKDGALLSDSDITGLLIALLFAGQHTSSITSTWTSLFIMKNADVMKRVNAEIEDMYSSSADQKLNYDSVCGLELVHNCMREALRLHPPLVLLMRKCKKDLLFNVDNRTVVVPEGDTVMISPSVGMRIPSVFPNPDTFDPDRYTFPREEHKIPYGYLGFGGGMHSCMGQNFAFLQVKTILSIMFKTFEMEMVNDVMPECDYEAMVVGPKGDCRVKYKRR